MGRRQGDADRLEWIDRRWEGRVRGDEEGYSAHNVTDRE